MTDTATALFKGSLSDLNSFIVWSCNAPMDSIGARDIFSPVGLDRMIERHAVNYAPGDPRAVLSIWSKYYLATVIYPSVAAPLILGRDLPVALDQIGLVLSDTGEVRQVVLQDEGLPAPDRNPAQRFLPLIDSNLAPAIDAMAEHSGLSARVYWSNAGHYFYHLAHMLATIPNAPPAAGDALAMMQRRRLADGRRNPLFQPVQTKADAAGSIRPMRRLCCIRFLLDDLGYCDNCPLESGCGRASEIGSHGQRVG